MSPESNSRSKTHDDFANVHNRIPLVAVAFHCLRFNDFSTGIGAHELAPSAARFVISCFIQDTLRFSRLDLHFLRKLVERLFFLNLSFISVSIWH